MAIRAGQIDSFVESREDGKAARVVGRERQRDARRRVRVEKSALPRPATLSSLHSMSRDDSHQSPTGLEYLDASTDEVIGDC